MTSPKNHEVTPVIKTPAETTRGHDDWQRRFGVPWERVERAVRAVSDRAVAASRRRFADLEGASSLSDPRPS